MQWYLTLHIDKHRVAVGVRVKTNSVVIWHCYCDRVWSRWAQSLSNPAHATRHTETPNSLNNQFNSNATLSRRPPSAAHRPQYKIVWVWSMKSFNRLSNLVYTIVVIVPWNDSFYNLMGQYLRSQRHQNGDLNTYRIICSGHVKSAHEIRYGSYGWCFLRYKWPICWN